MRVLFQNRKNALESWGGDTTQMIETKKHLEKVGVDVDISLETSPNLDNYDLVHVFNIQNPEYGLKQILNAEKNNLPVALSSIYWDNSYSYEAKEKYLYSESNLIRNLAKINTNIPHFGEKLLNLFNNIENIKNIKSMLEKANIILPNSYSELEIIVTLFKIPEIRSKALIVPNGVSKSNLKSKIKLKNNSLPDNYVLEVGRVEFIKGQLNLIKSLFNYPEIPIVFIGNGLDSYYGKQCIKFGEKRGNTYFLGQIPHNEIFSYYAKAKVHALPSFRESPGLVNLEASLFDVNCVVTIHCPIPEYFGFDVFTCNPSNILSIRNAVIKAWNTPKNDKLKKRILNKFIWEKTALKTLEAYKILTENI